MHPSVRAAAFAFAKCFEGDVDQMYVDSKGLVTTGRGYLIDSISAALALPWEHRGTGGRCTQDEVVEEWKFVKGMKIDAFHGARHICLPAGALEALFYQRLDANEVFLSHRWKNWNDWPADAQLGAHSCAWAAGAAWAAPHFDAAVSTLDFVLCAGFPGDANTDLLCRGEAWLHDSDNPGLHPRNLANKLLFQNAARVVDQGLDRDTLYWPSEVTSP